MMKQNNDIFDGLGSIRTEKAPKKTIIVYKLMRLENGKLYPLFIDSSEPVKLGVWYDADSPDFATLKKLEAGYYYLMNDDKVVEKTSKKPSKKDVISVTPKGLRYIFIEATDKKQRRFGENRRYWNIGLDGSGSVSMFSMRPGWHAGSLPTMRQIGKGSNKNLRDDSFVWTECEISADIDYNPIAQKNPDKDMPDTMPKNGYYLKATNADKVKSQADKVGWYVAGTIKINRIISDKEARSIIDKFNKRTGLNVLYDFKRESGKEFDPKRGLVGIGETEIIDFTHYNYYKALREFNSLKDSKSPFAIKERAELAAYLKKCEKNFPKDYNKHLRSKYLIETDGEYILKFGDTFSMPKNFERIDLLNLKRTIDTEKANAEDYKYDAESVAEVVVYKYLYKMAKKVYRTRKDQPIMSVDKFVKKFQMQDTTLQKLEMQLINDNTMNTIQSLDTVLGALVYHNSPYLLKKADGSFIDPKTGKKLGFDHRFMSKGEGAQVHGWGSYFSVKDLRKYSENLPAAVYYDGKLLKDKLSELAYHALTANNLNIDNAIYSLKRKIETIKNSSMYSEKAKKSFLKKYEDIIPELEHLDQSKITRDNNNHNYVVEIPDDDGFNYLEEDKPIKPKQLAKIVSYLNKKDKKTGDYFKTLKGTLCSNIYYELTLVYKTKEMASKFLKKCGIVGIHYFGKTDGECYVIFDENDAKIVKHTLYGISDTPTDDEKKIQDFQENIWKNGFNSVTLQQLNNLIKDIENGRELLLPKHRFAYERKIFGDRNRPRITRNAIAAALICGGGCVSNRIISTSYLKRYEWSERCEQLLEQWAKSEGVWFPNAVQYFTDAGYIRIDIETGESIVFRDVEWTTCIKIIGANYYSSMIDKSIDRVLLHNSMFQPSLNIIGFTKHNGRFKIVADQTFVQGVPATEDDIAKFIEDNLKGFVYNRSTDSYIKDDIEISDLHEANFVKTENGKTFLIDCTIKFTSKTFSGLFGLSSTPNAKTIRLGSLISEPTKLDFYENLYQQLESIVKNDSFEKNGIRKFILSHIPEDYKNDDIDGIVEVFYQRLRSLKCGEKGLGSVSHKFNIGDTIKMPSGVTAKIIGFVDGDNKYKIEFDDTVSGRKKIAIYFWKLEENAVLSDDYHVGDLICYKGFEETIFQIVGFKGNNYVVIELGDRTKTKNEIPMSDNDKLQIVNIDLLTKEIELEANNLGNVVESLQPSGLSGIDDEEFSKDLLVTEMRLLELEKLKDFGEKIGGSAKDRYFGRKNKENTDTTKPKGYNRLPTLDEIENFGYKCLHTQFKPSVADFEEFGLNKICARLCFFHYYGIFDKDSGYNANSILDIYGLYDDKSIQDAVTSYFIENKYHTQNYATKYFAPNLKIHFYAIDFVYTALSLNLEKGLKDDFDYKNVLKLHNRGNKMWKIYRDKYIFQDKGKDNVPEDVKQRVFNICYENALTNFPVFRVMRSYNYGIVFMLEKDMREDTRTWSFSLSVNHISNLEEGICEDSWGDIYSHYAELYVKGKGLYAQKYGIEEPDKWRFKDKEGLFAKVREGKDWRNGRNAEPKDFIDTFGFRAVEFGETMPQKERWEHLNRTFDSFMDLCGVLNIKPENISLGGSLAISFGSRGRGGKHAPAAHYEPTKKVINLTRRNGAGCLAHEWFHAFDNQVLPVKIGQWDFSENRGKFASNDPDSIWDTAHRVGLNRPDDYEYFYKLNNLQTNYNGFIDASFNLDKYEHRSPKYWSTCIEYSARAFEWYVIKKLSDKNQINEYLAQIPTAEPDRMKYYPYPHPVDYIEIESIFNGIFANVQQVKTETGVTIR